MGTTSTIWCALANFASLSVVGPGTASAASYQSGVCAGQKYGLLKTSCRQSTCTPRCAACSSSGRCFSNIASWISFTEPSDLALEHWMSPARTVRGMVSPKGGHEAAAAPRAPCPRQVAQVRAKRPYGQPPAFRWGCCLRRAFATEFQRDSNFLAPHPRITHRRRAVMARKNGTGNGSHKSVQDARTDLLARAERNAEGAASCKTDPLGDAKAARAIVEAVREHAAEMARRGLPAPYGEAALELAREIEEHLQAMPAAAVAARGRTPESADL